jgi:hypothetical protein
MVDLMILLAQALSITVLVSGAYVACRYLREDLREESPQVGAGDAASGQAAHVDTAEARNAVVVRVAPAVSIQSTPE